MWICAIVVEGKIGGLYPEDDVIWREIPLYIYKNMMVDDDFDTSGRLLSLVELISETFFFSDEDRLKLKDEINELIEKQLVTKEDMQDILKLLQFAIDNHRKMMITPFWVNRKPSEEFE